MRNFVSTHRNFSCNLTYSCHDVLKFWTAKVGKDFRFLMVGMGFFTLFQVLCAYFFEDSGYLNTSILVLIELRCACLNDFGIATIRSYFCLKYCTYTRHKASLIASAGTEAFYISICWRFIPIETVLFSTWFINTTATPPKSLSTLPHPACIHFQNQ